MQLLVENGAKVDVVNNDGKTPGDVAIDPNVKKILNPAALKDDEAVEDANLVPGTNFTPNYLECKPVNYKVDLKEVRKPNELKTVVTNGQAQAESNISNSGVHVQTKLPFTILKIRVPDLDSDFIEIDVPKDQMNFDALTKIICTELSISDPCHIERIRKLPNTRLRRDAEVLRLENYSELDIIIKK